MFKQNSKVYKKLMRTMTNQHKKEESLSNFMSLHLIEEDSCKKKGKNKK